MVAVQSSNVARIGHEGSTLRVEFKDGKLYEWADISYDLYLALLNATSKGQFIARHLPHGVLSKDGEGFAGRDNSELIPQLFEPQRYETDSDMKLQSYEPDSCCGRHIRKAISEEKLRHAESWECPECGCTWKPKQVGDIRHWSPVPLIAVF